MSKDKAEEKANNAQRFLIENKLNDLVLSPLWCKDKVYASDTLMKYTESLSTENAQLREALKELVELAPVVIDQCVAETYVEALESRRKYILASEKANQLLTDNTQDDEKDWTD